ncbi:MAG: GNAT family N-acetyltransferase [Alphaproteobacteria bacterium]
MRFLLYVAPHKQAPKYMAAARAASRIKPVVVIKSGRHEASARAAASHTGALAGADGVYMAAFRRAGMLRVLSVEEMFDAVATLANWPRVQGCRLGIISNGGGIGVMATDSLIDEGGTLADLSPDTVKALDACLPATWSRANPIDIIGDAGADRYAQAMEAAVADRTIDALLVLNCPTAVADGEDAAQAVAAVARKSKTPVFTSWLGEESAGRARARLTASGVPTYDTPDQAVRAFMHVVRHQRNQDLLMEVPPPSEEIPHQARAAAEAVVSQAMAEGREWLNEAEAKTVLKAYGIPAVATEIARDADSAARLAEAMGYPVAVKIFSPDITHKSDVGGVILDLTTADQVREAVDTMLARVRAAEPGARIDGVTVQPMVHRPKAIELIAGVIDDPTFGPAILFGRGGTAVEVIDDKSLALPPLNRALAVDAIMRTRVYRQLRGYRDRPPADLDAIVATLLALAEIAADLPAVAELDINPLYADADGVLALDARIRLAPPRGEGAARFAIMPYPRHLEGTIKDREGKPFAVRPIRPQDAPRLNAMISRCDPHDIRMRFFTALRSLPKTLSARLTQIDYDREMAFVAVEPEDACACHPDLLGVVRLMADPDRESAEYAVIVRSDLKGRGLGFVLMQLIIAYARKMGIKRLFGEVLKENKPMLGMCEELGFIQHGDPDDLSVVRVTLDLV